MKYFYDGQTGETKDRFHHRQVEKSPLFRIGENFEKYDFTSPALPFRQSIINRLEQLRNSNKYLRFWFSGGKDSRLILDTSREIGMEFDEIVIIKNQLLGSVYQMGAISEIMHNAVDYIETIKGEFKKTKITIKDFQASEFELVFENNDWYRHTNCWYIHSAIEPNLFYRYVNPVKKLFEDITDRIDVMGSIHPHVYWDDGWKFVFVDFQFPQNLWHTCENFLTTPEHPEILHSYVHSLILEFERKKIRPYRFQENLFVSTNQHMRNIRELLPEYQFDIYRPDAEWPKKYNDSWRPSDELYWKANPSFKSMLTCLMCYFRRPRPRAFDLYCNKTNWEAVVAEIEYGGILSQEFIC